MLVRIGGPALLGLWLVTAALPAAAQGTPAPTPGVPTTAATPGTSSAETYDLSITEERIVEPRFTRAAAVGVGDETASVSLRIGVSVEANGVEATLRNVQGQVRFHATVAPLLQRLEARGAGRPGPAGDASPPPGP